MALGPKRGLNFIIRILIRVKTIYMLVSPKFMVRLVRRRPCLPSTVGLRFESLRDRK